MVSLFSLWLPILLSALFVFILSSIIHMVFGYHKNDFIKVPDEDDARDKIGKLNIPPGDYVIPCPGSSEEMKSKEYIEKTEKGPVLFMTVLKNGPQGMGSSLFLWFIYSVVVSIFAAYVSGRILAPGTHYLQVFRYVGTVAFAGYSLALLQNSIWYKRKWSSTIKSMFDGLIYALFTAGVFGWLWPAVS